MDSARFESAFKVAKAQQPYFQVSDNIYMIFHEKSAMNFNSCNCYLINEAQNVTLIDPGCTWENLLLVLKQANLELKNIKHILLTHAHSDHYALVKSLRKATNVQVHVHALDRAFLEDPVQYLDFLFERDLYRSRPHFHDLLQVLEDFVARVTGKTKSKGDAFNPVIQMIFNTWDIQKIIPDHTFDEGDTLPAHLKVIHTPGHTPGHCAFWDATRGLFFCGDIDFNRRGPVVSSTNANISDYKRSLARLSEITTQNPIKCLLPGHWSPVFSRFDSRLREFQEELLKREYQILEILQDQPQMSLDAITQKTFTAFVEIFRDYVDEETKDSFLFGEAAELQTNRNYLLDLKSQGKVEKMRRDEGESWRLANKKA